MRVYLLKDVPKVGMAGEIVKVSDGFGTNFIIPRKLGVEVTPANEEGFKQRERAVAHREQVIESATSMLAERIKALKVTIKRKMHGDELYGALSAGEVVDAVAAKGISIARNQVDFGKSIKRKGTHEVTIKLSSKLQPQLTVVVIPE